MNNIDFDSPKNKYTNFLTPKNNIKHYICDNQINLPQLSKDIFILINYIRTNTNDYISDLLKKYTLNNTFIQDILSDITKIKTPLLPYNLINEISLAAKDQLDYIKQFPNNSNNEIDIRLNLRTRLTKYGQRTGRIFESVIYKKNTAEEIVFQIIKEKKGRNIILCPKMKFIGIACGLILSTNICAVIDIVQDFKPYKNKKINKLTVNSLNYNFNENNNGYSFLTQRYKNIRLNSVNTPKNNNNNDMNSFYKKNDSKIYKRKKINSCSTNRSYYSNNFSASRVSKDSAYVKKKLFYVNKYINNSKFYKKYDNKTYNLYNCNKCVTEDWNAQYSNSNSKIKNKNYSCNNIFNTNSSFENNSLENNTNNVNYTYYNSYNRDSKINIFRNETDSEKKNQLLGKMNEQNNKIKRTKFSPLNLKNINNINNDIIKLEINKCNNIFKKPLSPTNLKLKINDTNIYGDNINRSYVCSQTNYDQNSNKNDNIYLNFFNNLYIQPGIKNSSSQKIIGNDNFINNDNENNDEIINRSNFSFITLNKKINYKNKSEVKKLIKLYNQAKEFQRNIENYNCLSQKINHKFDQTTPYTNNIKMQNIKSNLFSKINNNKNYLSNISFDKKYKFNPDKKILKQEQITKNIYIPLKIRGRAFKTSRSVNKDESVINNSDINFFNKPIAKNSPNEKMHNSRNILYRKDKYTRGKIQINDKLRGKKFMGNNTMQIINYNKKNYYD